MSERAIAPTQSALLELRDERAGLQEGYRFLDEKRLILAAEILAEIGRYQREKAAFDADDARARAALEAAVMRHGLDGLALYPTVEAHSGVDTIDGGSPAPHPSLPGERWSACGATFRVSTRIVLGVTLQDVTLAGEAGGSPAETVAASPEAECCRAAFRALIPRAASLAALCANLERLRADYARTARRARALEDVLLPEIRDDLQIIEAALEELEREESVRARWCHSD